MDNVAQNIKSYPNLSTLAEGKNSFYLLWNFYLIELEETSLKIE